MSADRTPNTEQVRDGFALIECAPGTTYDEGLARFDRWLNEVRADAWDEGANTAWERSTPEVNAARYHWRHEGEPTNPYRSTP